MFKTKKQVASNNAEQKINIYLKQNYCPNKSLMK